MIERKPYMTVHMDAEGFKNVALASKEDLDSAWEAIKQLQKIVGGGIKDENLDKTWQCFMVRMMSKR